MQPYAARNIQFLRLLRQGEWRVKLYSVALDRPLVDEGRFGPGLERALHALPELARTPSRPGVGFCILHQGRGADYIVLGWWDRENELPFRIYVKTPDDTSWRPARGSESVCVWDLEVISFERDAYITTVLASPPASSQAYLDRVLDRPVVVAS
jgi:hypothetical protein